MSPPDPQPLRFHEDPILFREALNFTAAETGFASRLIEKDYFCTVLLRHLTFAGGLVFKGGTCLAKVHASFYRLSEDLDFVISTPVDAGRGERSRSVSPAKEAVSKIAERLAGLRVTRPLTGSRESRHYAATVGYMSALGRSEETIKIEVSLREPLRRPSMLGEARTLLLSPLTGEPWVPAVPVPCLTHEEAMAEKLRAALSRRDVAIRDFFDVDHAVRRHGLRLDDRELIALVREKLSVPPSPPVDVSPGRRASLTAQVEAQLRPVLREQDFVEFDLGRAFEAIAGLAAMLSSVR
ncbi:MAG: nucleotidyl transferase AbiEii/AbiGii toxin family protein [Thermoanaerobaculia bacterium]